MNLRLGRQPPIVVMGRYPIIHGTCVPWAITKVRSRAGSRHGEGAQIGPFPGRAQLLASNKGGRSAPQRIERWRSVVWPGIEHRRFRAGADGSMGEDVIVAKGEPTPVVPRCEGLPNGSEHRSMDRATSFVRACLYVSLP